MRLTARIHELSGEVKEARALEKQLGAECKTVKAGLQKAHFARKACEERVSELQGRIDEALIGVRAGEEVLRKAVLEKEEALVNYDLLRVEVKRLRDALSGRTEEVLSLENRAAQLELSMEARKKEVEGARAVQRMEAKLAEEQRHALALDFGDRTAKIALLKTRYEVLCARLRGGGGGGEGGEPVSQAFHLLKAAQRREELQREGDELEAACVTREKELSALRHTLAYLNARNDAFRGAFAAADPGGSEAGAVRALEAAVARASDALFKARRSSEKAGAGVGEGERRVAALKERGEALQDALQDAQAAFSRAVQDKAGAVSLVADLEARLESARARLRGGASSASSARGEADEMAIGAQALRDAANSTLYLLGQLGATLPGLGGSVAAGVKERGLRIPARPVGGGARSSSSSSSGSGAGVEDILAIVTAPAPESQEGSSSSSSSSSSSGSEEAVGGGEGESAAAAASSRSAGGQERGGGQPAARPPSTPLSGRAGGVGPPPASATSSAAGGLRAPSPMTVPSSSAGQRSVGGVGGGGGRGRPSLPSAHHWQQRRTIRLQGGGRGAKGKCPWVWWALACCARGEAERERERERERKPMDGN